MALFDAHVMVDWSAAAVPTTGADSIWIGIAEGGTTTVENIATRRAAETRIRDLAAEAIASGRRMLIGFDFPFGYPAGVAKTLTGEANAMGLWAWLDKRIEDGPDNANNRYAIADEINRVYFDGIGPFWGRPATAPCLDIPTKASSRKGRGHPPERRLADAKAKGAKTVWQLAYAGAVGSQVLMGLPVLYRLRHDPTLADHIRVWPFETGLTAPDAPIVLAEIYPSLIPPDPEEDIKDAGQVRAVANWLAGLDRDGVLAPLFAGPQDASAKDRSQIVTEEAWILGLDAPAVRPVQTKPPAAAPAPAPRKLSYVRDPAEIYAQSFATVRAEAKLDHLPEDLHDIAIRLVHACGMPEITNRLAWSADVVANARSALSKGAAILCDCEAVRSMIVRQYLPSDTGVIATLNAPEVPDLARNLGTTRSAAAVDLWRDHVAGAIVVIGNAPTALFHLLERLDEGWPHPAAILGFPVGFVGAAESKAELAGNSRGAPFLTLRGRRGGSAIAAAALNALAAGLRPPR